MIASGSELTHFFGDHNGQARETGRGEIRDEGVGGNNFVSEAAKAQKFGAEGEFGFFGDHIQQMYTNHKFSNLKLEN